MGPNLQHRRSLTFNQCLLHVREFKNGGGGGDGVFAVTALISIIKYVICSKMYWGKRGGSNVNCKKHGNIYALFNILI